MERLIPGLPDMAVVKEGAMSPCVLEVRWPDEDRCPHCGGAELRIKASFWYEIKSYRVAVRVDRLVKTPSEGMPRKPFAPVFEVEPMSAKLSPRRPTKPSDRLLLESGFQN